MIHFALTRSIPITPPSVSPRPMPSTRPRAIPSISPSISRRDSSRTRPPRSVSLARSTRTKSSTLPGLSIARSMRCARTCLKSATGQSWSLVCGTAPKSWPRGSRSSSAKPSKSSRCGGDGSRSVGKSLSQFPTPDSPTCRLGGPMDRFAGTTAGESRGRAVEAARDAFGPDWNPDGIAIAPGRIELLGNHIDYNGGPVLAAAIDRFIVVAIARETGREQTVRAIAADAPDEAVATLDAHALAGWRNASPPPQSLDYVRGLLAGLQARERSSLRPRLPASIAIAGDVPIGFGISSSAALCVSLALALADGFSGPEEVVLLAQEAEHRAGTPCGTMDQSASISGGVIAFDGATLAVERLSPHLGDLVFAVADSGVKRSLSTS